MRFAGKHFPVGTAVAKERQVPIIAGDGWLLSVRECGGDWTARAARDWPGAQFNHTTKT